MSSTSTLNLLVLSTESTTKEQVPVNDVPHTRRSARTSKSVENAIYAYIRAIRALGRNKINTSDIAEALSLSVSEVNHAISALEKKGVKILNV
jgi:DNA-binding GntR family transcriptional regulator